VPAKCSPAFFFPPPPQFARGLLNTNIFLQLFPSDDFSLRFIYLHLCMLINNRNKHENINIAVTNLQKFHIFSLLSQNYTVMQCF